MSLPAFLNDSPALGRRYQTFQTLVARAEQMLARRDYRTAVVYAQIAATYAMNKHTGLFASPQLESLLLTIGRQALPAGPAPRPFFDPARPVKRVLHVFSVTTGIGGHTRMVWRWIKQDTARQHSVAVTRQGSRSVPARLKEAIAGSGGSLHLLDHRPGDLLTWAGDLRRLAAGFDLVVLHMNPNDVIPVIALADRSRRPPVIFLNHADHVFWLGRSIIDVLANQRESGFDLSTRRRGIYNQRCAMIPIVIDPLERSLTRAEAKRQLGLPEDALVLLSIARPHKYLPLQTSDSRFNGLNFPQAVLPVLERFPNAQLLLVGPEMSAQFEPAAAQTGGRVRAYGLREDTAVFYQAADVYLDSFPLVSITSLLEAGNYAVPLVSYFPFEAESGVLGADTPGLMKHMHRVKNAEELTSVLVALLGNEALRSQSGAAMREELLATHSSQRWAAWREAAVQAALDVYAGAPGSAALPDWSPVPQAAELDRMLLQLFDTEPDLDHILKHHVRLLPLARRVGMWARTARANRSLLPGLLLPDWLGTRIELVLQR